MGLNKKSVDDINVKGQRVLVRCDFNVPLQDGKITDENRLVAALPTIKKLIADGGKIILCSHLGKPKGEPKPELSLAPVAKRLTELLGQEVKFVPSPVVVDDTVKAAVAEMKDGEVNENNVYQYSYYSETLAETAIPAERIRKSRVSRSLTDEQMKDLALSYVDMISLICVKFAEYITYIDDEPEEGAAEDRQAIELTIEALKFTLPHLNFSGVNAKMLRDHLHERGDGGCTLCDRYEPNWKEGEKYIRLYDLLNSHPLATDNTKWLYKWLKKTFPRRLRVNTGGWTG